MIADIIRLDGATKSFGGRGGQVFPALRGVSLRVAPGDFIAVLGKSGSGKSTLLNLIAGIDRPTSGEVHAADADLNRLGENKMATWRGRNIGVVFQFFQLLPTLTAEENILLAMDFVGKIPARGRRARARELLVLVGLSDQASKLPSALSGGQQQRAALEDAQLEQLYVFVVQRLKIFFVVSEIMRVLSFVGVVVGGVENFFGHMGRLQV